MSDGDPIYDFAILGAGVSGLSLAYLLCEGPLRDRSILVVDGARDDDELRTLSFWSADPTALEPLVRQRWSALRVQGGSDELAVPLEEHRYQTLFFAELQAAVKAKLAEHAMHRVVEGRVTGVDEDEGGVLVRVGERRFRARWAFDSRFRLPDLEVDLRRWHLLRQYFHGWVIRARRDAFDPARATFIDFRTGLPPGTAFFYVLPFGPREALVELVSLARVDAEPALRDYLARVLGLDEFDILDREAGISPMTEQPFQRRRGARIRAIGIQAGRLKASTGYALTRILDDAAAIVRSLAGQGHPFEAPPDRRLYRFLDGVLLELWSSRPGEIPRVFSALFRKNPGDRVLRFLDERASPRELLSLIASLPWLPFLRAAARWVGRRLWAALTPRRR